MVGFFGYSKGSGSISVLRGEPASGLVVRQYIWSFVTRFLIINLTPGMLSLD